MEPTKQEIIKFQIEVLKEALDKVDYYVGVSNPDYNRAGKFLNESNLNGIIESLTKNIKNAF